MSTQTLQSPTFVPLELSLVDDRIVLALPDGTPLPDASLIVCTYVVFQPVTFEIVRLDAALAVTAYHSLERNLETWQGADPSYTFDAPTDEVQVTIVANTGAAAEPVLKIRIRPRSEKPGALFLLA